jgi:hypothetical protein
MVDVDVDNNNNNNNNNNTSDIPIGPRKGLELKRFKKTTSPEQH